jgi:hypothetical protein
VSVDFLDISKCKNSKKLKILYIKVIAEIQFRNQLGIIFNSKKFRMLTLKLIFLSSTLNAATYIGAQDLQNETVCLRRFEGDNPL